MVNILEKFHLKKGHNIRNKIMLLMMSFPSVKPLRCDMIKIGNFLYYFIQLMAPSYKRKELNIFIILIIV